MQEITFETMPKAMAYLLDKIEIMERILRETVKVEDASTSADKWMNLDELIAYLPDHPAKSTVYNLVSKKKIPFHKGGKKLRFRQSEIDGWLALGAHKSGDELIREANLYCEKHNTVRP